MIKQNEELFYLLRGLGISSTVLHIGAHPDDEEIGLLSYLTRKYGVRVVYWSATRGEGGQNKIGPHTGDALGVYRTWESEIVREKDGAENLFGPFVDFGYSKDAEEGLDKWGRTNLVREIVRAIRISQPHIVVSRWSGTPTDQHGHHETIGQVTAEAFEAAGDPTQFPELQAQGLSSWRPLKLYLSEMRIGHITPNSAAHFGSRRTALEQPGILRINCGEYDPISGQTYQERAWMAYNLHQTQALGLLPKPGDFYCYFRLQKSLVPVPEREETFFDGFDPTITGLASLGATPEDEATKALAGVLQAAKQHLEAACSTFRSTDPVPAVAPLLAAHQQLQSAQRLINDATTWSEDTRQGLLYYLAHKITALETVTAHCMGLQLEAIGSRPRTTPGATIEVMAHLWNHRGLPLDAIEYSLELPPGWHYQPLAPDTAEPEPEPDPSTGTSLTPKAQPFAVQVAADAALSSPYWLSRPRVRPYEFHWPAGEPAGRAMEPPPITALCHVTTGEHSLVLRQALTCREAFPGGFRELPVQVVAPISLFPNSKMQLLTLSPDQQSLTLQMRAENNRHQPTTCDVSLAVPSGWEVSPSHLPLHFAAHGESKNIAFVVNIPGGTNADDYPIHIQLDCDDRTYTVFADPVRLAAPGMTESSAATCIRETFVLTPAEVQVSVLDINFAPELRYAYLEGAAQRITESLEPFGIPVKKLTDREIAASDLSQFDAIIVGHNGYLLRDAIGRHAQRLLDYAFHGGTLIVEFQGYGYQGKGYTPYPFKYNMPHDRVVYEDAPVQLLAPEHFLFNHPNKIQEKDFDDWVIERGLYFFGEWDERYTPLMSCADPNEAQKEGGCLLAHYGRGTFLYTGYSFFRQIPAGNPGALRLFANILALPEARVQERMNILRHVDIFKPLSEEELRAIARLVSEVWVEDGHILCRKGDPGDSLYIIYTGTLEIVNDDDKVVYRAQAGDCVGELAVLCNIPRTATMRAHQATQLLELKREPVDDLLDRYPQMARRFIDVLVRRLYISGENK